MLTRYSRRTSRIQRSPLVLRLHGALGYDRLGGSFHASALEAAGEALDKVTGQVRMVFNGNLDAEDAKAAKWCMERYPGEEERLEIRRLSQALLKDWRQTKRSANPYVKAQEGRRYRMLATMLLSGRLDIRVLPAGSAAFLNGKAGIVRRADGDAAFMGVSNESRMEWETEAEFFWQDTSTEGVAWVQSEFDVLWSSGIPLPQAVISEIQSICAREETSIDAWRDKASASKLRDPGAIAGAFCAQTPAALSGDGLLPWQRNFVNRFLQARASNKGVRLQLADEAGMGNSLSLGTCAVLSALLGDGPSLVLAPATLALQWQIELHSQLGIKAMRWSSLLDRWEDHEGWSSVPGRGKPADIVRCPGLLGIVALETVCDETNAVSATQASLLRATIFGCVILDQAHKATRDEDGRPNAVYTLVSALGAKCRHLLLGMSPARLQPRELHEKLLLLAHGERSWHRQVLGTDGSPWKQEECLGFVQAEGERPWPETVADRLLLFTNPLPPKEEDDVFMHLRRDVNHLGDLPFTADEIARVPAATSRMFQDEFSRIALAFNPVSRHVVMRRREDAQARGWLLHNRINLHPCMEDRDGPLSAGTQASMQNASLIMSTRHMEAYDLLGRFCRSHQLNNPDINPLLLSLPLRRIGSSTRAAIATVGRLLNGQAVFDNDVDTALLVTELPVRERQLLEQAMDIMQSMKPLEDTKADAVCYYAKNRQWNSRGCVIYTQFLESAEWLAEYLSTSMPNETIALYGGGGSSSTWLNGMRLGTGREAIQRGVASQALGVIVTTDASSDGLNTGWFGTLVNFDLPWNPARIEQRRERILRIGGMLPEVDVLNLAYVGSIEEKLFDRLGTRIFHMSPLFDHVPDIFHKEWLAGLIAGGQRTRIPPILPNRFRLRYSGDLDAPAWKTSSVLSSHEVSKIMGQGW